jgi:YggT family protein
MLIEAAQFLLDMLLEPFAAILLLRFHLQWLRAPMRNPLGEFIMLITNPLVLRVRRFVPALMGLDTASLLLAVMVEAGYLWITLAMHDYPMGGLALLAWTVLTDGGVICECVAVMDESEYSIWTGATQHH